LRGHEQVVGVATEAVFFWTSLGSSTSVPLSGWYTP
jgi:hypothetical protein